MLKRETHKVYEKKIGETFYTIESASQKDACVDILDALVVLMRRDIAALCRSLAEENTANG